MAPPDQQQRERIVRELDTTMLVEAAAGTGKTTSMVDHMIGLVSEGRCPIDSLVAVTFTRQAAAELRSRFQLALEQAARSAQGEAQVRLQRAFSGLDRCFIGTIHAFCARLLRERPIEAGVDLNFVELDDTVDVQLREQAWQEYVAQLYATGNPLLLELEQVGLQVADLAAAFRTFANYPDVEAWPAPQVEPLDYATLEQKLLEYAAHIDSISETFPQARGNDELMSCYEQVARATRRARGGPPAELLRVLEQCQEVNVVQKEWPNGKSQGKAERDRWQEFVRNVAAPAVQTWRELRYPVVIRALQGAVQVYDRLRSDRGGLNFQDLLLKSAVLLRRHPAVRAYFRRRFTHLLVDEFQDTDPIQAEVLLLLVADDPQQTDWRKCRPVPGALFVVGDPKQSIYRFRRADIVTYNSVRRIIEQNGGAVVQLSANFRTVRPLVEWANKIFEQEFPETATDYSPAFHPLLVGRQGESMGDLQGIQRLMVPAEHARSEDAVRYEADLLARTIRRSLDAGHTVPRSPREIERGVPETVQPGDFLKVTWRRSHLAIYAEQLQQHGIPHEITGGRGLESVREAHWLCHVLRVLLRPDDAIALVGLLRGPLFGLDDPLLYDFRRAGGRFDFRVELPASWQAESRDLLAGAFARLNRYAKWLRQLPPLAALDRIADDLGLWAWAAAQEGGNVRAGSFAKLLEMLRTAQQEFSSLAELAEYFEGLISADNDFDGLPARPHEGSAVRLMNLHKVKGLEAPVVFLACPAGGGREHAVELHVDRSSPQVCGYLAIRGPKRGYADGELLATPVGWGQHEQREQLFLSAERQRLLYVAATRAGSQVTVVQREEGNRQNPWQFFESHTQRMPEAPDPGVVASRRQAGQVIQSEPATAASERHSRRDRLATPTYEVKAAKELALSAAAIPFSAGRGEHGTEWGTLVHVLLEAAIRQPGADLRRLATSVAAEEGLPESAVESAVATVEAVQQSELWQRAQQAEVCLTEVPFEVRDDGSLDGSPQMPTIIRGVIDLAFREPNGWVLVDYKTDPLPPAGVALLVERYRPQVELYAKLWPQLNKETVVERGLFFTRECEYVPW